MISWDGKRIFVLWSIGSTDRSPDWAPDKLSSFGSNLTAVIALVPPPHFFTSFSEPVSSVNVYLASPVCGSRGYKLEATPLMIQKGPRYVRLSSTGRIRYLPSLPLFALHPSLYLYTNFAISIRVIPIALRCRSYDKLEKTCPCLWRIGKSLSIEVI